MPSKRDKLAEQERNLNLVERHVAAVGQLENADTSLAGLTSLATLWREDEFFRRSAASMLKAIIGEPAKYDDQTVKLARDLLANEFTADRPVD